MCGIRKMAAALFLAAFLHGQAFSEEDVASFCVEAAVQALEYREKAIQAETKIFVPKVLGEPEKWQNAAYLRFIGDAKSETTKYLLSQEALKDWQGRSAAELLVWIQNKMLIAEMAWDARNIPIANFGKVFTAECVSALSKRSKPAVGEGNVVPKLQS